MRRYSTYLTVALLTFLIGASGAWVYFATHPKFVPTGSLLESDYCIYWFKVPGDSDPQAVTFFGDFRSAEVSQNTFDSNATAGRLIERGEKLDAQGRRIGARGIATLNGEKHEWTRIFWTDGKDFWCIQAPSLELALEFEKSKYVQIAKAARIQTTAR